MNSAAGMNSPMPVIYLLDGRANFQHTVAAVDLLVVNARMPRSMVVGIANTDRNRDFTAVATEGRSSGGADCQWLERGIHAAL